MASRHTPSDEPVYPRCRPAIDVLAEATGLSQKDARAALRLLVEAGYAIAPREPTNSMLDAYMHALRSYPTTPRSCIVNIGKARLRWAAMASAGTAVALSIRRCGETPPACPPCEDCGSAMVQTSHDTWECGAACPASQGLDSDSGSDPKGENSRSEVEGEASQSGGAYGVASPNPALPPDTYSTPYRNHGPRKER